MNSEGYNLVNILLAVVYAAMFGAIVWLAYYFLKTMIKKP